MNLKSLRPILIFVLLPCAGLVFLGERQEVKALSGALGTVKDKTTAAVCGSSNAGSKPSVTITAWCHFVPENVMGVLFSHLPHFMQSMALCWSWLETLDKESVQKRGVILYKDSPHFRIFRTEWRKAFLVVMGCDIQYLDPSELKSNASHQHIFFKPVRDQVKQYRFFWKPEDGEALRQALFALTNYAPDNLRPAFVPKNRTDFSTTYWLKEETPKINIGIVNRRGSRQLVNAQNISDAIAQKYPMANVQQAYMEDMKPLEQMLFWSKFDVIVTPHGAGETNMVFLPRDKAVIEIFPPHYYPLFFWKLAASLGIRQYGYFHGAEDHQADFKEHSATFEERVKYRTVNVTAPVDEVMKLVRQAIVEEGHERWNWFYPGIGE